MRSHILLRSVMLRHDLFRQMARAVTLGKRLLGNPVEFRSSAG